MIHHTEAQITVNGNPLTEGQSMTVRVALCSFLDELRTEGLGEDEHGKKMTEAYSQNLKAILHYMGLA